ncbi:MAG: ECF transporter S component [Clostridia bacterium]|nr:ECF transporter S component [Clostridia bacterium]
MWKNWLFSEAVLSLPRSKKVAYIAVVTAFTIVANTFFEAKFFGVQFSLTIFVSVLSGIILGSLPGFCACFLGDLLGFFLHPLGEYSPFIGIATGLMAAIGALCAKLPLDFKGGAQLKLFVASTVILVVCTAGITTVYLNLVWYKSMTYWECLATRLFIEGQIWNSVANTVLLVVAVPPLALVKQLRIKI